MQKIINVILLILVLCFSPVIAIGQQSEIDSLLLLTKTDRGDTNKLVHLYNLSNLYESIDNYSDGLNYSNKALLLADSLSNNTTEAQTLKTILKYKAKSYNVLGNIYSNQGNYIEALENYLTSLNLRKTLKDKIGIARTYRGIGIVHAQLGNYPEALKNFLASLKIFEELGNQKGVSSSYNGIGNIYESLGNYPKALKNHFASLKISQKLFDKNGIACSYNNIGLVYDQQGNYLEALKNHLTALKIREEIDDKLGIAYSHNNIGNAYESLGNYSESIKNHLVSIKIKEELGDKAGIASSYNNIGIVLMKQKQYKESKKYLNKGKTLSKEIGHKGYLSDAYYNLTKLDSVTGNYKETYENHKLYILYRDSLINEKNLEKTIQTQMTFDFEKKEAISDAEHRVMLEKQNAVAEEKNRKQKIITWSVVTGLLLVLVFAGYIFRSLRFTRKQKQIIEIKNKETELQKQIIEEKHKEITDSINYAERIQRSFLATKTLLDENLKDYFVFFQPKDVVSGDFYWAKNLINGNFVLATADSTGHGVPGAIMSILNISSLEKSVEQNLCEPSEILNYTRKTIIDRLKKDGSDEGGKDGMDCSLICFDFFNKKLTYAAANNPIWIARENELLELKADKMPVGKHDKDHNNFTQHEFKLQKNDVIYALTDGLPDQFGGPKGKKFMYKQLKEILIKISNLPMNEQKDIIYSKFTDWKAKTEQVDDILIIGVRI